LHRRFKADKNSTEDDARIGLSKTSVSGDNVKILKEMVISNSRISVEELAEEIFTSHRSCYAILCNHLKIRRVAAKVVLKLLTFEQKSSRQSISENFDYTFLKRIITGYEMLVYGYDMETKKQSSQGILHGEPRSKKERQCRSNVKVLLIAFFDYLSLSIMNLP